MKRIIYIFTAITLMTIALSCDDFLEKNPPSVPSEAIFWQSEKDFNMAMAGIYGKLRHPFFNEMFLCFDNLTDNSFDKNGEGGAQYMMLGEIDPTSGGYVSDLFELSYSAIARVNQFIERLDAHKKKDISDEVRNNFMGQAKFFRAFYYMYLNLCYGDVPLITNTLSLEKQYIPVSPKEQVYAQIMKDFDEAINLLPDMTYSESKGHITKDAAKAFKAKIMLQHAYVNGVPNKAELQNILALLESIKGYSLQSNYSDLFESTTQENSPEIMFSVKNLAPSSCTGLDMKLTNWLHTCPLRNLIDEFELAGSGQWEGSVQASKINEDVINNPESPVDEQEAERAKLFVGRDSRLTRTVFHSLKPFPNLRYIAGETDYTGFGCYKYLKVPEKNDLLDGEVSDQDIIHMRYGYILLMIAEIENEVNGPTEKVYNAVNLIRNRAGQDNLLTGLSQTDMRLKIRHEWRVETAMEGLHYFEMKRWHTLESIENISDPKYTSYTPKFEEKFYFWPIPQGEIEKSGGILTQNPAYK